MSHDCLDKLLHDVNSKCSSLKDAALVLKTATDQESREFLALMQAQAQSLVSSIEEFRRAAAGAL